MPSWLPGSGSNSNAAPTAGAGRGGGGQWLNLEVPGQVKNTYGELTGENSQFAEWGFELTRTQRLIGFGACLAAGFALSLIGSLLLLSGSFATFAVLYSFGIVISLVGTGFLIGFMKQLRQMFKGTRIIATGILIAAFVMVWVSAFAIKSTILAIVFVVVLYLAFIWYSLSYIPYARDFVKGMVSKVF
ncbi:SFT2-domain-containing protein [Jaminaea rosea]|uniref:Protein transport protein SFT2 n=1 Tax=Jaminaea rosea TaxID=1569628 RepID=A0A316UYM8_9BASI|nr:SFT2-domain-containing protein [Jaminaea rosea]PWN30399.1 SFT2-domain-containing protein [Jaminaea rosea]